MNESLMLVLCEMQAKLFVLSQDKGYSSEAFITTFMKSSTAADLDKPFHHMQWAGEHYLISRLEEEEADKLVHGECYDAEVLYLKSLYFAHLHG